MSQRRFLCALLAMVLCASPARAWIRMKSLDARVVSYLHADHAANGNGLAEGRLELEGHKDLARDIRAFVSAEIVGDQRGLSSSVVNQIHDRMARRPNVNVTEAYIDLFDDRLDLRIGKQKIAWGTAEGLNPTDVFGAFDYADLLNPRRLGLFGLRAFFYTDKSRGQHVEAVFLPFYSPSRAGQPRSRWRPVLDGVVPVPTDVRLPANTLANADYGLRFARRMGEWDAAFSYARVIDDVAGGARAGGILVTPLFLKKRTMGLDASRVIDEGRWEIHVEAAYTSTPSGNDDDVLQVVAGARRGFTDVYRDYDLDLTVEWAGEHVYSRMQNPAAVLQNLVQRPAPGSILVDAGLGLTEFTTWNVSGIYTFRGADAYLVSTELVWNVTDVLELRAGFDGLSGDGGRTNQSFYEENDRWRIETTIHFR